MANVNTLMKDHQVPYLSNQGWSSSYNENQKKD